MIAIFVLWSFFYANRSVEEEQLRSLEYDTVWSSTNGRNEFYKFAASVSRYLQSGKQADLEEAQVKFDILLSRIDTWNSGSFKHYLNRSPELLKVNGELLKELDDLTPYMRSLSAAQADDVYRLLDSIAKKIEAIAGTSYLTSIRRFTAERTTFRDRLMTEKRIVLGLLILATALLAVVMRQNGVLTRANEQIAEDAKQLSYVAKHDALTALPNRTLLNEHLNRAREQLTPDEILLAVALDLDGFKAINDTLGHAGGDALLISLSRRLRDYVNGLPGRNLAARVGGDEFVLIFWYRRNGLDIDTTIRFLAGQFSSPLETTIGSLLVGSSIGYAVAESREEIGYVVLNADLALTEAKASGRGTAREFAQVMRTRLERRLQIERQLPFALRNSRIQPHYQLQFDMETGEPVGLEALARWNHSDIGPVSPSEFIPIAEASGDVVELGRVMLKSACRDVQLLPDHLHVAVNLSMIQVLNDDIPKLVTETLRETGLSAARLKLEITESVFMQNVEIVSSVLSELQELGVSISLDDFGTGYSALSYLSNFMWNELKIDRSFVTACEASPKALNIVNVIKSLADKMNATLLVEGLETKEQVDTFRTLGCRFGQGFYYSKPKPIYELRQIFCETDTRRAPLAGGNAGLRL